MAQSCFLWCPEEGYQGQDSAEHILLRPGLWCRYFHLVQQLNKRPRRKDCVVVRRLREEADGIFRYLTPGLFSQCPATCPLLDFSNPSVVKPSRWRLLICTGMPFASCTICLCVGISAKKGLYDWHDIADQRPFSSTSGMQAD